MDPYAELLRTLGPADAAVLKLHLDVAKRHQDWDDPNITKKTRKSRKKRAHDRAIIKFR